MRPVIALLGLLVVLAWGQSNVPELPHKPVPDWGQLPPGWNLGETSGIDTDSRGHVYLFNRGPHPIVEFEPGGKFIRSWGDDMFVRSRGFCHRGNPG